jgi:hypothetical protein
MQAYLKENRRYILLVLAFIIIAVLLGFGSAFSLIAQFFIWTSLIVGALLLAYNVLMAIILYQSNSQVKLEQSPYTILPDNLAIPKNLTNQAKEIESLGLALLGTIQWPNRRRVITEWVYRDEAKTTLVLLFDCKSYPNLAFVSRYRSGLELEIVYDDWAIRIDEAYLILRSVKSSITVAHQFHQQMFYELSEKHGAAQRFETLEDSITEPELQYWQTKALLMARIRSASHDGMIGLSFFASGLLGLFVFSISGSLGSVIAMVTQFLCLGLFARLVNSGLVPENQRHLDARKKRKATE